VDAEMFYLTIGVLKDLIKNINKENKCMKKQIQQIGEFQAFNQLINYT
jgi:hypothetical protein